MYTINKAGIMDIPRIRVRGIEFYCYRSHNEASNIARDKMKGLGIHESNALYILQDIGPYRIISEAYRPESNRLIYNRLSKLYVQYHGYTYDRIIRGSTEIFDVPSLTTSEDFLLQMDIAALLDIDSKDIKLTRYWPVEHKYSGG